MRSCARSSRETHPDSIAGICSRRQARFAKRQPVAAEAIRQTLLQFQDDAFDPSLRTHKLKGDFAGYWASSAGYDLRIVFQFVQQGDIEGVLLLSVGTHDEVY